MARSYGPVALAAAVAIALIAWLVVRPTSDGRLDAPETAPRLPPDQSTPDSAPARLQPRCAGLHGTVGGLSVSRVRSKGHFIM